MSELSQRLLRINWPEGVSFSAAQFREQLAKANLPSSFFHYGTEVESWEKTREVVNGKFVTTAKTRVTRSHEKAIPLNGRPPVRVIGGKSWVGVVADPGASDLLLPHVGCILDTASTLAKRAVKVELDERKFGIRYTEHPVKYMLREMAIKRRGDRAWNAEIEPLVTERVFGSASAGSSHGIDGICAHFGFEPPVRELLDLKVFALRCIGMHNKTSDGKSNEYVSLVDAEVWMNADLDGIWQVGNLTARGYGRLIARSGGWA